MINVFEYGICNIADETIFEKQCRALEKNIPGITKSEMLIDVDGSKIQKYFLETKSIMVINDKFINEVAIKSEIDIDQFFI